MTAIRVLQLATAGPLYGAERGILALSRHFDPARVDTRLAIIEDDGSSEEPPLATAARGAGLNVDTICAPGRINLNAVRQLTALIEKYDIEIVHSHGYKADMIALLACKAQRAKTKLAMTPHGWSTEADLKLRFYEWLDRQMFRLADAVIPLSSALAEELAPVLGSSGRLTLIENGIDIGDIDAAQKIAPYMAALRRTGPVIGFMGRLVEQKDVSTLLSAFAKWARCDANIVIVGEGDARCDLERQAQELGISARTHFVGFRADRLDWLRGFDLLALPSLAEGMPRCVMEAMAAHIPVVATDIDGIRELMCGGQNGMLFPPGDPSALADAFSIVDEPAKLKQITANARKHVELNHGARNMASQYEELFAAMMD